MSQTADISHMAKRGMSLIELIVAMAIFTIIMSGVMVTFTSVTNTVRRSYRTMDTFEATHGALMTVEQDVQTAFSAPAIGADFHFYGEPYGFVFVGIGADETLGRLTYAVHVDTSRMESPATFGWRGERVTIPRDWNDVYVTGLETYYTQPGPMDSQYVDFEVEVLFGLLLRKYEENINSAERFDELLDYRNVMTPSIFAADSTFETDRYDNEKFPWFCKRSLWNSGVTPPWNIQERMETVEQCHYWLQLMHGPGLPMVQPWDPMYIWWNNFPGDDYYWFDHNVPASVPAIPDPKYFLWDHVVARDFVISSWILDPGTGERIIDPNTGGWVSAFPTAPIFQYSVESGRESGDIRPVFNTMFNQNYTYERPPSSGTWRIAFEGYVQQLMGSNNAALMADDVTEMTRYRDMYDVGNPLQSRLPSAFDINLFVINPPVTTSAPTDVFNFSQTIHLPSGFLRRNLAVD